MADPASPSIASPFVATPIADHAPVFPSPLNPDSATRPSRPARTQKETLKKREASARASTPDVRETKKPKNASTLSPMRYSIPEPRLSDYEPVKEPAFASHEPVPFLTPEGAELKKPIDHAENKKSYRYTHCVADPLFRHKQFYRQSDAKPYGARMSFEDSDRQLHFDASGTILTNEKGWRMGRANVVAREGRLYYEVKIIRGVPAEGPIIPPGQEGMAQPHIRMGFARREAPLDAPVGFDSYSYGMTDIRFNTMHRSRPNKLYIPVPKSKSKSKATKPRPEPKLVEGDDVRTGDVIGLEINLPSLSLHEKVVKGDYNPAVDTSDGFDDPDTEGAHDIIRDRIPVPYRGNIYFEQFEYQATKPMETYSDRGPFNKVTPSPNHDDVPLRSLPHSSIRVWKNGKLIGTAFENLMAFLPSASQPLAANGARIGFDDGMVGYFPAVAAFQGGIAQVNFGPDFWYPPTELQTPAANQSGDSANHDVAMSGVDGASQAPQPISPDPRKLRAIGDRFKEQIAEDVVWDIIDEADFFAQDGGYNYKPEAPQAKSTPTARGMSSLQDEVMF